LGKLYQFVERWFEKINWIMLEVEQIECCKRDKVEDWLWKNRKAQAVLVSPRPTSNNQEERVVVFQPPAAKAPARERPPHCCSYNLWERVLQGQFAVRGSFPPNLQIPIRLQEVYDGSKGRAIKLGHEDLPAIRSGFMRSDD
jgi:hypothetical protein